MRGVASSSPSSTAFSSCMGSSTGRTVKSCLTFCRFPPISSSCLDLRRNQLQKKKRALAPGEWRTRAYVSFSSPLAVLKMRVRCQNRTYPILIESFCLPSWPPQSSSWISKAKPFSQGTTEVTFQCLPSRNLCLSSWMQRKKTLLPRPAFPTKE